jgi:GNAT superfamily N-acetyltransferase
MKSDFTQPRIVIRPTLPADAPPILEFCKRIWDGHDYIPYVWDEWRKDPLGHLFTAEYAGQAVGVVRITHTAPGQWWFEGFRVDPAFQGQGIGSRLHEYIVNWWLAHGDGKVRLWTNSKRVKVHHLCERLGFKLKLSRTMYAAPALSEPLAAFASVRPEETPSAVELALKVSSQTACGETMDISWQAVTPNESGLRELLTWPDGCVLWWRDRQGLLCLWNNDEYNPPCPAIALVASEIDDLPALLLDARRYAHQNGFGKIVINARIDPQMDAVLLAAGFAHESDDSNYEYEREHPRQPFALPALSRRHM